MLEIIKMNNVGRENNSAIMYFDFTFENINELPNIIYALGNVKYVIADNSTALNRNNQTLYRYSKSSGKWNKVVSKDKPIVPNSNPIKGGGTYNIPNNEIHGFNTLDINGAQLIEKEITENGTYTAKDDNVDGYKKVEVDIAPPSLIEKEITENGTYNASEDDADGYSQVVVDVPPPSNEFYPSLKTQSLMAQNDTGNTWLAKTWTGLTSFNGSAIWTDGNNIYYSYGSNHYILDKSTSIWSTKTWSGLTNLVGGNFWTEGDNIYYSKGSDQYYLPITKKSFPKPSIKPQS